MSDLFTGWSSNAIIALVSVVGGLLTVIATVIAISWCCVRRAEIASELKRDLVARGLPVEQIERIVQGPPSPEVTANAKELEAQLASYLVQHEVSAPVMEEVLYMYQGTEPATKRAVFDSLVEIIESGAEEQQLLAAVRTVCPPKGKSPVVVDSVVGAIS